MTLKNIIRAITLVPLGVYLICCCFHVFINGVRPQYLDCGIVESKSSDEVSIKHGVRTELYLNIRFEKTGFKSIGCSPTTYFSKKVGERVCFDLNQEVSNFYHISSLIGIVILAIGAIVLLVMFIGYISPEGFWDEL